MLEIKSITYEDLTQDEKATQPDNGSGKEYAEYLEVKHEGETLAIYSDAMEPEDCIFSRDLSWVKGLVLEAYEMGKRDGEFYDFEQNLP